MSSYRVVGLVTVVAVLGLVVGLRLGRVRSTEAVPQPEGCTTCCLPLPGGAEAEAAPAIPTGSGRPCLVEFGSQECAECQQMNKVLEEVAPRLKGKVDIVRVDSDVHLAAVQHWRLRVVPTQILVDAGGQELWRHEGALTADELVKKALQPTPAGKSSRP